jgi:transcriptional regulator with XRE-family HTH domain
MGLSIDEAARLASVSPVTLSHLENAKAKEFSVGTVERICEALGLELRIEIRDPTRLAEAISVVTARRRVRRRQ